MSDMTCLKRRRISCVNPYPDYLWLQGLHICEVNFSLQLQTAHPARPGAARVRRGRPAEDVPRGLRVRALPLLQHQPGMSSFISRVRLI